MGDAVVAAVAESEIAEVEKEAEDIAVVVTEAAVAAKSAEERAEEQVGEVSERGQEDPELLQGCGCAIGRTCPPCIFGTGKT